MEKFFDLIRQKREETELSFPGIPFLVAGLGNPGREYRDSRHNFGFMVVDQIANEHSVTFCKGQGKALTAQIQIEGQRVILAKPQAYMNLSGQAVVPLLNFYKIARDRLLVIHDDLDLSFGMLRMRPSGGSGGQKGLASIIQQLGGQDFARLRCGIGHPPGQMEVPDYVLARFSKDEEKQLPAILESASKAVSLFVTDGIQAAMTRYNGLVEG